MPYLMPNGKWRAKRMIHGQTKTKVFPTKQEAKKWEANQEKSMWEEDSCTIRTVSLLDFANAYLDMAKVRFVKKTLSEKKLAFKYLFKTVSPSLPPENLSPAMAFDAMFFVSRSVSGNSSNVMRKNLLAAWSWGKKYYGLPKINPFEEVEKFPADRSPRYVPSEEDFWRVYAAAKEEDKTMLLLMLHTGARRGEVFRLKWEDVDFLNRKIRLGTRKTGHGGMEYDWIPMTTDLTKSLSCHRERSGYSYVFTDPKTGLPYQTRNIFMMRLCKRAGVKRFGFHAIRHLSATILAYGGLDIPTVQAVLRHKNPNTTAKYIKSLGIQHDKLDSVFQNRRGPKVLPFEPLEKAIGT